MIGSDKVIETGIDSEPMKAPMAILGPHKVPSNSELGVVPVAN